MKEKYLEIIDEVIKWGTEIVSSKNNEIELEKNLVDLYTLCISTENTFDSLDYPDSITLNYETIKTTVSKNFPEYGYYLTLGSLTDFGSTPELLTGDAVEDLADIVKDLLNIKWRIQNESLKNGIQNLKFTFDSHLGIHLVELLNYIKRK